MSNVFCVANFILNKLGSMTTMKLQKLVYYCQAWSLAWDDKPLFEEDFQAWANGPVCPILFNTHRGQYSLEQDFFKEHPCDFTNEEKETIESVIKYYGDKTPHWLGELTHKERPWKDARGTCSPGDNCTNVISRESMQEYYGALIVDE